MSHRLLLAIVAAALAALWLASLGEPDSPGPTTPGANQTAAPVLETNRAAGKVTSAAPVRNQAAAQGPAGATADTNAVTDGRGGLTLRGRIVDHIGQSVANATLAVTEPWTSGWLKEDDARGEALATVITADDGRFVLELPPRTQYLLAVEAPRRPAVHFDLLGPQESSEERDLGDLRVLAGLGVVLEVRRADRGEAIAGARITYESALADPFLGGSAPRRTALSDARGRAVLYGIPLGDGRIRVEADGYATTERNHHHSTNAEAAARLTIALEVGHSVGGRIWSADSQPLADVRVVLTTARPAALEIATRSASDGSFLILGAPLGRARIDVEPVRDALAVSLEVDVPLRERLDVRLGAGAILAGDVRDAVTGLPIADATVRIARADGTPMVRGGRIVQPIATTATDGRFQIAGLDAGRFRVAIASQRHRSQFDEVALDPTTTPSPRTFTLRPAPRILVTVTDARDLPVAGARIETLPADFDGSALATLLLRTRADAPRITTTKADGRAELLLDRDACRLLVRAEGHPATITEVLQPVESVDPALSPVIRLETGARLAGHCRDAAGNGVGAVLVRLEPIGAGAPRWFTETMSRADGGYTLGPVAAGAWKLVATTEFGRAAKSTELSLDLPPGTDRLLEIEIR